MVCGLLLLAFAAAASAAAVSGVTVAESCLVGPAPFV